MVREIKQPSQKYINLTNQTYGQTINANQNRAFYVEDKASLVLKNLTIINGYSKEGGAIKSTANLTIIDSTIANSYSNFYGGAIYSTGRFTLINSAITLWLATFKKTKSWCCAFCINCLYSCLLSYSRSLPSINVSNQTYGTRWVHEWQNLWSLRHVLLP